MKTKLHHYYISDATTPEGRAAYDEIKRQIGEQRHGNPMHCIAHDYQPGIGVEDVELDAAHLFENQWNEAGDKGRRLFDWFEVHELHNKRMRRGHWLEVTDEMHAARESTRVCGYCGALYGPLHSPAPERGICTSCAGSEYLTTKYYDLLRVAPLGLNQERAPLTSEELDYLRPIIAEAQKRGEESKRQEIAARTLANIRELREEAREVIKNANNEANGRQWFYDRGFLNQENLIYHNHTRTFSWGWRNGVNPELLSQLLAVISEFPYRYEIKTEDGRTLNNEE